MWTRLSLLLGSLPACFSSRFAFMRQAVDKQKAMPSPIPHPYPDVTNLDTLVADAEAVEAQIATRETQLSSLRKSRITKTDASAEFENDAKRVGADTKDDDAQEIAAGFAVASAPSPVGAITAPTDLSVTMGR